MLPLAAFASLAVSPLAAQDGSPSMIRASDAEGVLSAVKGAGYTAEYNGAAGNEGEITLQLPGGEASILFSDCGEDEQPKCETLVLSVRYDRNTPISDAQIATANQSHRYVSVWRDDDSGDPYVQWAIFTGELGIPAPVFLGAILRYSGVADDFGAVAFEGDPEASETEEEESVEAAAEAVEDAAEAAEDG